MYTCTVSNVYDQNPTGKYAIPIGFLVKYMSPFGKLKPMQPFEVVARYSRPAPQGVRASRLYYLAVKVTFDVMQPEQQTILDAGEQIRILYATKGEPHFKTGNPNPRDLWISLTKFDREQEELLRTEQEAKKRQDDEWQRTKDARKKTKAAAAGGARNGFAALLVE
jgi:hypothetical protein